jgi:uncharacterized protein
MTDFVPLLGFRSGHRQTILGHFARKWLAKPPGERRRVLLPDGDALHVYDTIPDGWEPGHPVVIIVHGLTGSHESGTVLRLAWECLRQRLRVLRVNLRGCGGSMPDSRRPYHAGGATDIREVLRQAAAWAPNSPLWLVGLSLGGNIVLKLAGETPPHELPELQQVLAVAPPIDLQRCSDLLNHPHNALYQRTFVRDLTGLAQQRARHHGGDAPNYRTDLRLCDFDDAYTAPQLGYGSCAEYYTAASSLPVLGGIRIPTHILAAEDDPIIDAACLRNAQVSPAVRLQMTRHGGHLGYVTRPRHGGWCWLEREILRRLKGEPGL